MNVIEHFIYSFVFVIYYFIVKKKYIYYSKKENKTFPIPNNKAMNIIACILLFIAIVYATAADPDEKRIVTVWQVDRTYDYVPFYSNNLDLIYQQSGYTRDQLVEMRTKALQWWNVQFGIDTSNVVFDSQTLNLTIPNVGYASAQIYYNDYDLIASNFEALNANDYIHQKVVEFVLSFTNPNFLYGGRFAQLNQAVYAGFGIPNVPTPLVPQDSLSYGTYNIYKNVNGIDNKIRTLTFKSKFPTRADTSFRAAEESYLEDSELGNGLYILRIKALGKGSQEFVQFTGTAFWPNDHDEFEFYGIPE